MYDVFPVREIFYQCMTVVFLAKKCLINEFVEYSQKSVKLLNFINMNKFVNEFGVFLLGKNSILNFKKKSKALSFSFK